MRRWALTVLLLGVCTVAFADGVHFEYEHAIRAVSTMLEHGDKVTLSISVQSDAMGPSKSVAAAQNVRLKSAEEKAARSAFQAKIGTNPLFTLLPEAAGAVKTGHHDEQAVESAADKAGANVLLSVHITAYVSSDGQNRLREVDAKLIRLLDKSVLAEDVLWATESSTGAGSAFVNGVRIW